MAHAPGPSGGSSKCAPEAAQRIGRSFGHTRRQRRPWDSSPALRGDPLARRMYRAGPLDTSAHERFARPCWQRANTRGRSAVVRHLDVHAHRGPSRTRLRPRSPASRRCDAASVPSVDTLRASAEPTHGACSVRGRRCSREHRCGVDTRNAFAACHCLHCTPRRRSTPIMVSRSGARRLLAESQPQPFHFVAPKT